MSTPKEQGIPPLIMKEIQRERRDKFICAAMAGLAVNIPWGGSFSDLGRQAVKVADAVLAEADKAEQVAP